MDGGLSDRERRALSAIETELKGDRALERLLRSASLRHRTVAACLLGAVTVALLVAASITVSQPLIWGFAAAWTLTVVVALPLVTAWVRRRWQRRGRTTAP
jgi:membrane protein YdbS with pleckstrin-like domain